MEQGKNADQILELLEAAGFQREEVIHDLARQIPHEPAYLRILSTRQFYDEALRLEAILSLSESNHSYELTEISISDRFRQASGRTPLTLRAEDGDYLHASYAIYMYAGNFNTLLLQIHELGFAEVSGQYGVDIVRQQLKNLPGDCQVQGYFSDHSGMADYSIHIVNGEQGYYVKDCTIKFTEYPQLQHGTFAGVDTSELEKDMAAVNWANEQEILLDPTGQTFRWPIQRILERLEHLSTDIAGGYIGDILQLKYMQVSDLSEVLIRDQAWETFARLPQKEAIFPADIPLRGAANLMAGRHRLVTQEGQIYPQADSWQKMNGVTADGKARLSNFEGYPWTELRSQVRRIVDHDDEAVQIAARLAEGNLVRTKPEPGGKVMFVRVDPAGRQLDLLTPDMRVIPFNFHFDPEWNPAPDLRLHLKKEYRYNRNNFRKNHRKGKGLK